MVYTLLHLNDPDCASALFKKVLSKERKGEECVITKEDFHQYAEVKKSYKV